MCECKPSVLCRHLFEGNFPLRYIQPPQVHRANIIVSLVVSREVILSAESNVKLWGGRSSPEPRWGSLQRSPRTLSWWEGLAAPPQTRAPPQTSPRLSAFSLDLRPLEPCTPMRQSCIPPNNALGARHFHGPNFSTQCSHIYVCKFQLSRVNLCIVACYWKYSVNTLCLKKWHRCCIL